MGFQAEFQAVRETSWHTNALVFATEEEAEAYARDLFSRWMGAEEWRVVEVDKEVNYVWSFEQHTYYRTVKEQLKDFGVE